MDNYLRLQSSQPITDCGRKYNILYFILAIVGGLCLTFVAPGGGTILGILLGLLVGLCIKNLILDFEAIKLRKMQFALDYRLPYDQLITRLNPSLAPMNMHIEAASDGSPSITYNGMIYDIRYDDSKNFFTIWWRKNIARALLSGNNNISIYRKASVAMGIIGYYVQMACNGNSNIQEVGENKSNNMGNESVNAEIKFCPKCGNNYKLGTRFCPKCGNSLQ